jgi:hypothetical protein
MGMRCKQNHNHKFGCACNEKVRPIACSPFERFRGLVACCAVQVPEAFFYKFVKDDALIAKYKRYSTGSSAP